VSPHPLAPASARSKEALIGGKPVRFTGSRQFTAVVLIVALMFGGYLVFMWWVQTMHEISTTGEKVAESKKKKIQPGGLDSATKRSGKPKPKISVPSSTPVLTRTVAPDAQRIGDIVVSVETAQRRLKPVEHLSLTLRITNLSSQEVTLNLWSQPVNGA